jgi:hypothetical protein
MVWRNFGKPKEEKKEDQGAGAAPAAEGKVYETEGSSE